MMNSISNVIIKSSSGTAVTVCKKMKPNILQDAKSEEKTTRAQNNLLAEKKDHESNSVRNLIKSKQLPELVNNKITKSPPAQKSYQRKKLSHPMSNPIPKRNEKQTNLSYKSNSNTVNVETAESSNSSMTTRIDDQMQFKNDDKQIECLEAVVDYTTQIQRLAKKKGGLDSIIQANNHLVTILDKVVHEWFRRAQRRIEIGVITDEMFSQKALESKQIFCIQHFNADNKWLNQFKTKYNITDLDMRLLHIENNTTPPSVNINDIVLYTLKTNPVAECFSNKRPKNDTSTSILRNEINIKKELIPKPSHGRNVNMQQGDILNKGTEKDVEMAILNDEQAIMHLKPIEEYVLLKDNIRAVGLISQLKEIFSTGKR